MSEDELKKILSEQTPPSPDRERKKEAINMAMSAYDEEYQKKKKKNFQGSSFLSRLLGISHSNKRRRDMDKRKIMYGGMATAMCAILAVGVMYQQGYTPLKMPEATTLNEGRLNKSATPEMERAIRQQQTNKEAAIVEGSSAIPVPVGQPRDLPAAKKERHEPQVVEEAISDFAGAPPARLAAPQSPAVASRAPALTNNLVIAQDQISPPGYKDQGRDKFEDFDEGSIKLVSEQPVSTFSVDVDTTSYSFMRRQLNSGVLPQKDAIRIEELINYFDYDYPLPEAKTQPFKPSVHVMPSPWAEGKKLVHIGIKGYDIDKAERPQSNLVLLLDVSGSMSSPDKLPLLINSFKLMLNELDENDTVSIVTYAGRAGTVLKPTKGSEKQTILNALQNLRAGGSTAGAEGIRQAYNLAEQNFDEKAVNRVILATDGDFNVGIRNPDELQDFVERKRESGIFLSVFGFGQGNYNDHIMQSLAQNGNGVAAYIDNLNEARKLLVEEVSSTLFPIAKDVKIQVEFNPNTVSEYRLIGYETRALNREDFNNDKVDAGDIGAGHSVTAIYEIAPVGSVAASIDPSRYGAASQDIENPQSASEFANEYAFLKMRYKLPNEDTSKLITTPITLHNDVILDPVECGPAEDCVQRANNDVRFSTAVAAFGQLLKGSNFVSEFTYDDIIEMAQNAKSIDEFGYRAEFIQLVRLAKSASALPSQP